MTDINIDGIVTWLSNWFQDKLISGSNIKTINDQSLLGSGNISITGGGGSGGSQIDDFYGDSTTNELVIAYENSGSIFHTHQMWRFNFVDEQGISKRNLVTGITGNIGEHTVTLSDFSTISNSGYAIHKACDGSDNTIDLDFTYQSGTGYTPNYNGYTNTIDPLTPVKTATITIIFRADQPPIDDFPIIE